MSNYLKSGCQASDSRGICNKMLLMLIHNFYFIHKKKCTDCKMVAFQVRMAPEKWPMEEQKRGNRDESNPDIHFDSLHFA